MSSWLTRTGQQGSKLSLIGLWEDYNIPRDKTLRQIDEMLKVYGDYESIEWKYDLSVNIQDNALCVKQEIHV